MFPDAREVRLGPDERAELEARLRAPTSEQRHVFRARIVLMAAEGLSTRAIARDLGTMPRTVSHWRIRFAEEGLSGLDDRPRPGGRASAKYDETVSDQYVWRFLRAQKIDLDGRKSWCESAVLVRGKRTTLLWVGLAAMRGQGKFAPGDQFAAFARLRRRRPPLFIRREPYPGHELSLNTLGRPAMR